MLRTIVNKQGALGLEMVPLAQSQEGLGVGFFDAVIAGKSGALELVAFGSYTTKKAARKALKEIKAKGYKQAWVK